MMLDYHASLFSQMMEKGLMKKMDPGEAALLYDDTFLLLLSECDRHPEKEEEAKKALKTHAECFYALVSNNQ